MKRLISIVLTIIVLLGITFALTYFTNAKFIDYSFFVGLSFSVIIWFFTSKGGFTSQYLDALIQGTTNNKMEQQKFEFSPNLVVFTSLTYTILSLAVLLIYYRNYFFN